ncbi:hypothetical protein Cgig2_004945 [Carnegiea gigantea]|uniref:Uncharacterized protein n=1 Tax=Carnegiea gigantea TaxID=171969 RepID=A0A9Q1QSL3_9CARY|nr:hypothetical protein Cgig2_004945 [Carnegiea gigantea]
MSYEDSDFYYSSTSEKKSLKLFKKDSKASSSSSSLDHSLRRSLSHKPSSSGNKSLSSSLCRSSSLKDSCPGSPTKSSSSTLMRSFSKKSSAFGKKCTNMAKEQKARFYIMKRCVSMLDKKTQDRPHITLAHIASLNHHSATTSNGVPIAIFDHKIQNI